MNQKTPDDKVEARIVGRILLACIGAIFLAITFRLVRWIIGF